MFWFVVTTGVAMVALWALAKKEKETLKEQFSAFLVGALKQLLFIVVEIAKFVWKILLQLRAFYWSDGNERAYYAEPQEKHHHGTPRQAESPVARRAASPDYGSSGTSYSNRGNNHDEEKYKHSSRESAEAEARRMQQGESRKVNAYYNHELRGWYVGRSKGGY
jgi:hypothetical protein